jgi:hypothetical protein
MAEDPVDHSRLLDERNQSQATATPGGVSHILSHLKNGSIKERVPRRVTRWRHANSPGRSCSDAHANSLDLAGLESLQNSLLADPERLRGAFERKPSFGCVDLGEPVSLLSRHADSPRRAGRPLHQGPFPQATRIRARKAPAWRRTAGERERDTREWVSSLERRPPLCSIRGATGSLRNLPR